MKKYKINDIYYSIQTEGARCGTPNIFIRFAKCNLKCNIKEHGFNCDTEFVSFSNLSIEEIYEECEKYKCKWLLLTGGEPSLQIDDDFIIFFKDKQYKISIETNGTRELPKNIDWICVSPKTAEHTIKQIVANEVKYIRNHKQNIPITNINAIHKFISPAFEGEYLDNQNLQHCINLVKDNPEWSLSVQHHKFWNIK